MSFSTNHLAFLGKTVASKRKSHERVNFIRNQITLEMVISWRREFDVLRQMDFRGSQKFRALRKRKIPRA